MRSIPRTMHIYMIDPKEVPSIPTLPPSVPTLTPNDPTLSAFSPTDSYWIENVQRVRFDDCESRGILYRPKIVKEMMKVVEDAFKKKRGTGIMIKGPHGIGKSHSLVNLVRNLQYNSSCKYLVTFIPDCQQWKDVNDLYTAICRSFGTSFSALSWKVGSDKDEKISDLNTFVNAIDLILQRMNKKWVLVFDQISRLFARPELKKSGDLGTLPFPFSIINGIMKGNRIVSIISASANNEFAYRESHRGFVEYNHPCTMNLAEIKLAFEEVAKRSDGKKY